MKYTRLLFFAICTLLTGNFQSLSAQYTLNGSAQNAGTDCYQLTTQGFTFQNGAVWYDNQVDLNENFEVQFLMNFGVNDAIGADGMVFVFHQQGPNALGENGQGMGYQGFVPSLGIEFDTFENTNQSDPFYDHIAVHRDGNVNHLAGGNLAGPVAADNFDINIEDGEDHIVSVRWLAGPKVLQIYFDCELRIGFNYDIVQSIFAGNSLVTWGFTGATGGETNNQTVCLTPDILGLPNEVQICEGESVELSVNGTDLGSFEWTPTEGLSNPNSSATTATPLTTTTYTVNFVDYCGEPFVESTTIIVTPIPEIDLGPDLSLCDNESLEVSIDGSPGVSYLWENGSDQLNRTLEPGATYWLEASENGCSSRDSLLIESLEAPPNGIFQDEEICDGEELSLEFNDPDINVVWPDNSSGTNFSLSESGNYTVTFFDQTEQCSSEDSFELSVLDFPAVDLGPDIEACEAEPIFLDAGVEAGTYEWSTSEDTQVISVNESGVYSITATNGTCESTDEIEVVFNPSPEVSLGEDVEICEGESINFELEGDGLQFTWQGTIISPSYTPESSGIVTVEAEDLISGCTAQDEVLVSINPIPSIELPDFIQACEGEVVLLENTDPADIYSWDTGVNEAGIEVTTAGSYTHTVILNGCSNEFTTVVAYSPIPEPDLGDDRELCDGSSTNFELEENPDYQYFWNGIEGDNTYTSFDSGTLNVEVLDLNNGCSGFDDLEITRLDRPIIALPGYVQICVDTELLLEAEVLNADSVYWFNGGDEPFQLISEAGIYVIGADNECGTTIAQSAAEIVNCFCNAWVPNTFTPDGDGNNDLFFPVLDCDYSDFEFQIHNRWGELVFESDSPDTPWLGDFQDGSYFIQTDIYFWQMSFKSIVFDEVITIGKRGHVTVLR